MQSFVDEVTITLQSGHGGKGAVSFRREKYVPKGGPDGGDGGAGGNVVLRRRDNLKTLSHLLGKRTMSARRGGSGSSRNRHGADGSDLLVEIPPGTVVYDADTGELLADMAESDEHVLLRGGIGGKGNARFATSTNQAPRYAQDGMPGQSVKARIELKLMADIGLVGLPNAGKSSLLSAMSNARPKVGDYPFTTTIPNLGVYRRGDYDVVIADIPGIIEGAAEGHGLGLTFLKHISRTARLLFLVDLCGTPEDDIRVLEAEIACYGESITEKPRLLVGNKIDAAEGESAEALRSAFPDDEVFIVSVSTRRGLEELADRLVNAVHGEGNR